MRAMLANSGSDRGFYRSMFDSAWQARRDSARDAGHPKYADVYDAIIFLCQNTKSTGVMTNQGWQVVGPGQMWGRCQRIADQARCSLRTVAGALKHWRAKGEIRTKPLYAYQEPGTNEVKCIGLLITVLDWEGVVKPAGRKGQEGGGSADRAERPGRERADEEERQATQSPGEDKPRSTALDPTTLTFEDRNWDKWRVLFNSLPGNLPADEQEEWDQARERLLDEQKKFLKERVAAEAQERARADDAEGPAG